MKLSIKHFSSSCKAIIAITAMFVAIVCVWAAIELWNAGQIESAQQNMANTDFSKNR